MYAEKTLHLLPGREGAEIAQIMDINTELQKFQSRIGYFFRDIEFLKHALRHSSSTQQKNENNERLEFFGDAILDFVICEELFARCPEYSEGAMTDIKGEIVSRKVIGRVLKGLDVRPVMLLGKGIAASRNLPISLYANMFEAIIAAVYLDSGIAEARRVVLELLQTEIKVAIRTKNKQNYKSLVQELVQKEKSGDLTYSIISTTGPEHDKVFTVELALNSVTIGRGTGHNRKNAEQAAAEAAYHSKILSEQLRPEG